MDFDENPEKRPSSLWTSIIGSIIGGLIVVWLFKDRFQTILPVGNMNNVRSQYTNAESWELNRGLDGRISNLTVSRDAKIGNGNMLMDSHQSSTTYVPLENMTNSQIDNKISNKINVDDLTNMVQQRLQKRWIELNKRANDLERQRRFGMS